MSTFALPIIAPEASLSRYLAEIRRFPMLEGHEEYMLAKAWTEHGDLESAHKLVTSHLRLVAKIAMGYRGYGLPLVDLIAEGNIGLMHAVKRFKPDRGFRLATYAMWWIKASIQEFVLRSWSLVKIGTTAAQKKLFFNLRKLRHRIEAAHDRDLYPEEVKHIANELKVTEQEVVEMDRRMSGSDLSLNAHMGDDSEDEWIDFLDSNEESHETTLANAQDFSYKHNLFVEALETLNERERMILKARRLKEEPDTLEVLSQQFRISKERVRQIEARAVEKLQEFMLNKASLALPAA